MKIALNDAELSALAGLPHACIVLYLWIRARMDFDTGMVGIRPRISWHALTEWCYVEPLSGPIKSGSPSVQQVRRLAQHLVRAGLIRMCSSATDRQLIFECRLADRSKSVRRQPDRDPTDQPDRQPDRPVQRENMPQPDRQPDRPKRVQPDRHPGTGKQHHHHNGTNGKHSIEQVVSGGVDLIFPKDWDGMQKGSAKGILKGLDQDTAQTILDELVSAMQRGTVKQPFPFLRGLVRRHQEGTFTGDGALGVQMARQQAQAHAARLSAAAAIVTPIRVPKRAPGETLASRLKKMKTGAIQ